MHFLSLLPVFKQCRSAFGNTDAHLNDIKAAIWTLKVMMRSTCEAIQILTGPQGKNN